MHRYCRRHLADSTLLDHARSSATNERVGTADLLADLAEIDARKLYREAAYPSMLAWCVGELHLCEQAALKRIRAARIAREYPLLFDAVADGRLHLTAVIELKPHLNADSADELIAAAAYRTQDEVRQMLAVRFPRMSERAVQTSPCPATTSEREVSAQTPPDPGSGRPDAPPFELSAQTPSPTVEARNSGHGRITPLSADQFELQVTIRRGTREVLQTIQNLLGHAIPPGDLAEVLDRALRHYRQHLEKRRFGATDRRRRSRKTTKLGSRHIPLAVRRHVWERDRGQCTFVSESGRRCEARDHVEFDHIVPVARGGVSTVGNLRLRCRAHNQLEAERTFGAEFMKAKRKTRKLELESVVTSPRDQQDIQDLASGLRELGFHGESARRAVSHAMTLPGAPLEDRMRAALTFLRPRRRVIHLPAA